VPAPKKEHFKLLDALNEFLTNSSVRNSDVARQIALAIAGRRKSGGMQKLAFIDEQYHEDKLSAVSAGC
jgi:hypothetical protein